ncbi:MAG: DUF167 domain-containing protein [Thaumarchaeota archaeon]|nr:DUF167 domain-containing protein [Nitrososphaerota archaeon]
MLITIRVTPNAKNVKVMKIDATSYEVKVDAAATEGRANRRLVEILSDHFNVSKSKIRIIRGANSREKLVDIEL